MYGKIGRQKMLAEIYMECGSIFGKGKPMTDKQIIGFYDCVFFDEVEIEKCNGLIIKTTNKKEFTSHRELKKKARNNDR